MLQSIRGPMQHSYLVSAAAGRVEKPKPKLLSAKMSEILPALNRG